MMFSPIKIKLAGLAELDAMDKFVSAHRDHIKSTENQFFDKLIDSLIDEVHNKILKKCFVASSSFTLTLKAHEAIALYNLWISSTFERPSYSDHYYNIITMKMNQLHKDIIQIRSNRVPVTFNNAISDSKKR